MASSIKKILVLNGPNLNLLGKREPEIYGTASQDEIREELAAIAGGEGVEFDFFQSNHEGELIDKIQESLDGDVGFIIFNPAGYGGSQAIRDALLAVGTPFLEVHLSNIFSREEFRMDSLVSDIAIGVISGLGREGYKMALEYAIGHLKNEKRG